VFDALVSDRPYRPALLQNVALEILWDEARRGKRDRSLVQEFESIVAGVGAPQEHPLQQSIGDSSCR
jgi:HD-GYP domain-containing protein (c-di-GMP phosphodiesterase class II)